MAKPTPRPLDKRNIHEKADERRLWEIVPCEEGIGDPSLETVDLSAQLVGNRNTVVMPPFIDESAKVAAWLDGDPVVDLQKAVYAWPHLYFGCALSQGSRLLVQYEPVDGDR